ncbi:MAG: alanine:cation symporter family protein [Cellvibrionaceae bacterium]|nr:alanine:cation symporter family protein [Cellvibrionaceae bacterium]MCV6626848.1 alanine:cation symporter family protein [Cellvibrionaceae bacterium]
MRLYVPSRRNLLLHASNLLILLLLLPFSAQASIDDTINSGLTPLADAVAAVVFYAVPVLGVDLPLIVVWLVIAALFYTVYLGFMNMRGFGLAWRLALGQYADPKSPGDISPFKAVATALSGTVGVGNIGGVAVAIMAGGPGATFWLIMAGLLGMSTKMVECTLAVKYRQYHEDGTVAGGPMYYLSRGLAKRGWHTIGRFLGGFYAAVIVIGCMGIGNMFQSNQAYVQFVNVSGGEASWFAERAWLFGLILAALVGSVIIGGIQSIARVTGKLVPFMAILYGLSCCLILAYHYDRIAPAIGLIISGAFSPEGISGGILGVMIIGFQRALFSNEAGLGSASIAHAAVKTNHPASEGFVSLLEPFIDTVVICTLSSLVIITTVYGSDLMSSGLEGVALTSAAFESTVSWSPYPLAVAALLFAFSTMISWAYYGQQAWQYLVGDNQILSLGFKLVFCFFVALGCVMQLEAVLKFSDALVFLIAVPNIIGLYIMVPEVKAEVNNYLAKIRAGEIAK